MRFKVALVLPLLAVGSPSAIDVSVRADRVVVHSTAAPLSDILTRFAQAAGAELVYESSRPRQLVSVGIEAGSQAEALSRLLEGQGLNYALRLGPNGRDIQLLVIGPSTSTPAPAGASGPNRGRQQPPPELEQDLSGPEADEPEQAVEEPPEPEPAPVLAPANLPGQTGFVTPGAVGIDNRAGGSMPYQGNPVGPMTPGGEQPQLPQQPQPPQPASYPGPMAPHFPGPASHPGAQGS